MTNFIISHRRVFFIPVLAVLSILSLSMLGRAQQPQTPSAASVSIAPTDWIPYTGDNHSPANGLFEHQWAPENTGTPVITASIGDTRRGTATSNDENSASILAGSGTTADPTDMFTVAIDRPGDVKQPIAMRCSSPGGSGDAIYVKDYQSIEIWRIDPATGAVRSGYPIRLDGHKGVCSMPRIALAHDGSLFVAWMEAESGGDQISAVNFFPASNSIRTGPNVVSYSASTGALPEIREFALAADDGSQGSIGAAIIVRTHVVVGAPPTIVETDQIYASRFDYTITDYWPSWGCSPGCMIQLDDPINYPSEKWNPVIRWNKTLGQYDMAWGDAFWNPAYIMVQAANCAGTLVYSSGATPINGPTLDGGVVPVNYTTRCEFYMEDCYGVSSPYPGATIFFYRDAATDLKVIGTLLNGSTPTIYISWSLWGGGAVPGYPCSLTKRVLSTQEDLVAVWYGSWHGAATKTVCASYINVATWGATSATAGTGGTTNSAKYQSFGGIISNRMYVVMPNHTTGNDPFVDFYQIELSPFAFTAGPVASSFIRGGNDPCFSAIATGSRLDLCEYQSAFPGTKKPFPWSDDYTDMRNTETDEQYRGDFANWTYDFKTFVTSAYWPFVNAPDSAGIEDNTVNIDPYTAAYQTTSATVFAQVTSDGVSDIILGSGGSSWNITSPYRGYQESYYQPKCGVYYDAGSGHYMAIVTFLHEYPTADCGYEDETVDLTTGAVTPDPFGPIATHSGNNEYFRNWDVVADRSNGNFVFVFGSNYYHVGRNDYGEIDAVGFSGGSLLWAPVFVEVYTTANSICEVRACNNPDPANSGAYIVWRENPSGSVMDNNAGIGLSAVNSSTGILWSAGTILHAYGNSNSRGNPCVTAGIVPGITPSYWVLVGWEDQGTGGGSPKTKISACVHDNTGTLWPGLSNLNGVVVSNTGSTAEAHHPDAIVNPLHGDWPMLAYDQDFTTTNGIKFIEMKNLDLSLNSSFLHGTFNNFYPNTYPNTGAPVLASDGTCTWTMDDAKWSLYAYMQRRPKLVAFNASTSAFPFDRSGTYTPNLHYWVLCAFEAEAYNLYETPPTAGGGNHLTSYGLAGRYFDMWEAERLRIAGPNSGYLQNNILAWAINPNLTPGPNPNQPLVGGKLAIFANTNAQDLKGLTYTPDLGPIATCIDYVNTSNLNGIVRVDQVIPNYYQFPGGPLAAPNWAAPVPPAFTTGVTGPVFVNGSWFPLSLEPAAGSQTTGVPLGTWLPSNSAAPIYIDPEFFATVSVDYYGWPFSPAPNALIVTGHVPNIYGQWPLSLPDSYGNWGNTIGPVACGLKKSTHGAAGQDREFSVALSNNPAMVSLNAMLYGIVGRSATLCILNMLGATMSRIEGITLEQGGTSVSLDVSNWPSGSYVIQAIGDEGSHARALLTVTH